MANLEQEVALYQHTPSEEDETALQSNAKLWSRFTRYETGIKGCFLCFEKYLAKPDLQTERIDELADLLERVTDDEVKKLYTNWFVLLVSMVNRLSEAYEDYVLQPKDQNGVNSASDIVSVTTNNSTIQTPNSSATGLAIKPMMTSDEEKRVLNEVKTTGFPNFSGNSAEYESFAIRVRKIIRFLPWTKYGIFTAIKNSLPEDERDILAPYDQEEPDLDQVMTALDNRFCNSGAKYRNVLEKLARFERLSELSPAVKWRKMVSLILEIKSLRDGIEQEKALQEMVMKVHIDLQRRILKTAVGSKLNCDEVLQLVREHEEFVAMRENLLLETKVDQPQNGKREERRKGPKVQQAAIGPAKCAFHDQVGHLSEDCSFPVERRLEEVVKRNRCFSCLSQFTRGHRCRDRCTEPGCNNKHHHSLHGANFSNWRQYMSQASSQQSVVNPVASNTSMSTQQTVPTHVVSTASTQAFGQHTYPKYVTPSTSGNTRVYSRPTGPSFHAMKLNINSLPSGQSPTLRVAILVGKDRYEANVFRDDGASHSGIWQRTVDMLGLPYLGMNRTNIRSFEGPSQTHTERLTNVTLQALDGSFTVNWNLMVMPMMPETEAPESDLPIYELARAEDGGQIIIPEIMLASDRLPLITPEVQRHEVIRDTPKMTVFAHETMLGRFVSTIIKPNENEERKVKFFHIRVAPDCLTCQDTRQIFRDPLVESAKDEVQASYVDRYADQCVEYRAGERRFYATPPWLSEKRPESNFSIVRYVQLQCYRRLQKKGLLEVYSKALNEFVENGHSVILPNSETSGYFLPHRPVFKEGSTTSVRPVFNGSFARSGQRSLNELLFKGAWPQTNLHSTLVLWRLYQFAVFADIKKAFLQIRIPESDRHYFRYLWFDDNGEMQLFEMTSLIFGATSSPFVLYVVLRKLFLEYASNDLKWFADCIYMDDALVVASSVTDLKEKFAAIEKILELGSFKLHKLVASFPTQRQLDFVDPQAWSIRANESEKPPIAKVLGVYWNLANDSITWTRLEHQPEPLTRRKSASALAKLFDPLGLLGPFHLQQRAAMREAVLSTHDWDDPLAPQVQFELRSLLDQHCVLPLIELPRWIGRASELTIYIFCDASKIGYGAATYVLNRPGDKPAAFLLGSTVRLWPMEDASMPRKELGAALMGSKERKALKNVIDATFRCFSDSQCNLARIRKGADSLSPYEAHRVREILENTRAKEWSYVNTKQNPADILSRGAALGKLLNSKTTWFVLNQLPTEPVRIYAMKLTLFAPDQKFENRLCETSFSKLLKTFELLLFAIDRRFDYSHRPGVTSSLAQIAFDKTIAFIQRALLPLTHRRVLEKRAPSSNEPIRLRGKSLLIDGSGVLRLDSRVSEILEVDQNWITYDEIHKIVMPEHPITKSFIRYLHQQELFHARRPRLEAYVRKYYDIKGVTTLVRQVIDECIRCRRFNGSPYQTSMARLPIERVQPVRAFYRVGLDLFGPIHLPNNQKAYGLILVCTTSRAIHLEPVEDKSTVAVKQALLRFIARRGLPVHINSDNEKSFRKLNWMLRSFYPILKQVRDELVRESPIAWTFNSPFAPWEGGHYERQIRTVKTVFYQYNPQTFNSFGDLSTILAQVEAFVNARPLCKLNDSDYLTPTHLLTGHSPSSLPEMRRSNPEEDNHADLDLASRFRALDRKLHALWMKYCQNYLTSLPSWPDVHSREPRIGELVLERHPNKNRGDWHIGVISAVHPNPKDQVVRHVDLKMLSDCSIRRNRAVANLIPLEAEHSTPPAPALPPGMYVADNIATSGHFNTHNS